MHGKLLIPGSWDTHVHAGPDVRERKLDAVTLARRATQDSMGGIVFKNHHHPTTMMARLVEEVSDVNLNACGTVVLNETIGGISIKTVSAAAEMGTSRVELPTMSAAENMLNQELPQTISLIDDTGALKKRVKKVIDEIVEHGMVVGTGHIGVDEVIKVVEYTTELDGTVVITHPEFHAARDGIGIPLETEEELARDGVYFERCYVTTQSDVTSVFHDWAPPDAFEAFSEGKMLERIVQGIHTTSPKRNLISTDYGQPENPVPTAGLAQFQEKLLEAGISDTSLRQMSRENPKSVFANR